MHRGLGFLILIASLGLGCGENDSSTVNTDDTPASCGVAGKSVACVGPGACHGGQVCRADGTFGACDCAAAPSTECGAAGVVVTCIGPNNCLGAQACQPDGRYTACQCLPPPVTPVQDSGTPELAVVITSPKKGAVLSGSVVVKGTAGKDALAVGVSIAGGPFVTAKGTAKWSRTIDTTKLDDGDATIVVSARALSGLENVVSRSVVIKNGAGDDAGTDDAGCATP